MKKNNLQKNCANTCKTMEMIINLKKMSYSAWDMYSVLLDKPSHRDRHFSPCPFVQQQSLNKDAYNNAILINHRYKLLQ